MMTRAWPLGLTLVVVGLGGCRGRAADPPRPVPPVPPPAPAAAPAPQPAPERPGAWISSDVYDLQLVSTTRCRGGEPGHRYLGVELAVRSKTGPLLVAPRDASLRDGGLLFPALADPRFSNCRPVLTAGQVRRGRQARGFVVFEVAELTGKLVLEYTPTRWGGAGRVRIALPSPDDAAVVAGRGGQSRDLRRP